MRFLIMLNVIFSFAVIFPLFIKIIQGRHTQTVMLPCDYILKWNYVEQSNKIYSITNYKV